MPNYSLRPTELPSLTVSWYGGLGQDYRLRENDKKP